MAGLASSFLGLRMDKDWRVRASDWEADDLSERQTLYAANDALISMNIALQVRVLKFMLYSIHPSFVHVKFGCVRSGGKKRLASLGDPAKCGGSWKSGQQTLLGQAWCPLQGEVWLQEHEKGTELLKCREISGKRHQRYAHGGG